MVIDGRCVSHFVPAVCRPWLHNVRSISCHCLQLAGVPGTSHNQAMNGYHCRKNPDLVWHKITQDDVRITTRANDLQPPIGPRNLSCWLRSKPSVLRRWQLMPRRKAKRGRGLRAVSFPDPRPHILAIGKLQGNRWYIDGTARSDMWDRT